MISFQRIANEFLKTFCQISLHMLPAQRADGSTSYPIKCVIHTYVLSFVLFSNFNYSTFIQMYELFNLSSRIQIFYLLASFTLCRIVVKAGLTCLCSWSHYILCHITMYIVHKFWRIVKSKHCSTFYKINTNFLPIN